jgi:hypothetical protein
VTQDDVLFGYRLQLFALAAERGVSEACRLMGVHRSTYYRWKRRGRARGVGDAQAQGARRPVMPNQLSVLVEQRIVAFALGIPGTGRGGSRRGWRGRSGAAVRRPNGVYKTLCGTG